MKLLAILPQLIYVALILFGLGIAAADDGKPRSPQSFVGTLISSIIVIALLSWGGFFNVLFK